MVRWHLDRAILLWPALAVMVVGHSLFKPSLHVLIGSAAGSDEGAQERAFLWHYLAVNLAYVTGGSSENRRMRATAGNAFFRSGDCPSRQWGFVVTRRSWMRGRAARASTSPASMASGSGSARLRAVWLLGRGGDLLADGAAGRRRSLMAFANDEHGAASDDRRMHFQMVLVISCVAARTHGAGSAARVPGAAWQETNARDPRRWA